VSIHSPLYRELIDRLVVWRKESGVSQVDMAGHLDLTQPDISKIERFERRLDALEFFLWLHKVSRTPHELSGIIDNIKSPNHPTQKSGKMKSNIKPC